VQVFRSQLDQSFAVNLQIQRKAADSRASSWETLLARSKLGKREVFDGQWYLLGRGRVEPLLLSWVLPSVVRHNLEKYDVWHKPAGNDGFSREALKLVWQARSLSDERDDSADFIMGVDSGLLFRPADWVSFLETAKKSEEGKTADKSIVFVCPSSRYRSRAQLPRGARSLYVIDRQAGLGRCGFVSDVEKDFDCHKFGHDLKNFLLLGRIDPGDGAYQAFLEGNPLEAPGTPQIEENLGSSYKDRWDRFRKMQENVEDNRVEKQEFVWPVFQAEFPLEVWGLAESASNRHPSGWLVLRRDTSEKKVENNHACAGVDGNWFLAPSGSGNDYDEIPKKGAFCFDPDLQRLPGRALLSENEGCGFLYFSSKAEEAREELQPGVQSGADTGIQRSASYEETGVLFLTAQIENDRVASCPMLDEEKRGKNLEFRTVLYTGQPKNQDEKRRLWAAYGFDPKSEVLLLPLPPVL